MSEESNRLLCPQSNVTYQHGDGSSMDYGYGSIQAAQEDEQGTEREFSSLVAVSDNTSSCK